MQHNSVRYIVQFMAAVCLACSLLVSGAAVLLKDRQDANSLLDKQEKVLEVSGLLEDGKRLSAQEVAQIFDDRIVAVLIDLREDAKASEDVGIDPQTYDQLAASKDPERSISLAKNRAQIKRVPHYAVVYEVYKDTEKTELDLRVLPVEGMGLWGTMYGFLALDQDGVTIRGLTFYKNKETPGLGKEIENPNWKARWPGRKVFNTDWVPAIRVIKGPAASPDEAPFEVDGLSGATITSNGVTYLLRFWFGDEGFGPYLERLRAEGSGT